MRAIPRELRETQDEDEPHDDKDVSEPSGLEVLNEDSTLKEITSCMEGFLTNEPPTREQLEEDEAIITCAAEKIPHPVKPINQLNN